LGERIGVRARGRRGERAAVRASERVGHRGASVAAGWGRLAGAKSDAKYRIPLVSGRVARRSWSHNAEATMSCARYSASCRSVGRTRPSSRRATRSRTLGGRWEAASATGDELGERAGPDAARDRLAARLVGTEAGQHADQLDEVRPVVDDDHGPGAEVRSGLSTGRRGGAR